MNSLVEDEFKKVSYKRKGKNKHYKMPNINKVELLDFKKNKIIEKINLAKDELLSADIFLSLTALLKESLQHIRNPTISKIICFGLGKISEFTIPRYQLAFLLCLKERFHNVEIICYDPIFNNNDFSLLQHFDIKYDKSNIEGKFRINDTTLFYLPHCPKQLMNNLLWSNWSYSNLNKSIIIGNSINKVIEDNIIKEKLNNKTIQFLYMICPYVLEFSIVNNFKFYDIFNDTSIHIFPDEKLQLLLTDDKFWKECEQEPEYSDCDIEFIRNKLKNAI